MASLYFEEVDDDESHLRPANDQVNILQGPILATTVRSRADMFGFPKRHLDRIQQHFGKPFVENLAKNLGSLTLASLYSGLGGAEISATLLHQALVEKDTMDAATMILDPDAKPETNIQKARFYMAADYNSDCIKVLKSHVDPWLGSWLSCYFLVSPSPGHGLGDRPQDSLV